MQFEPFHVRHDVLQLQTALADPSGALDGWV